MTTHATRNAGQTPTDSKEVCGSEGRPSFLAKGDHRFLSGRAAGCLATFCEPAGAAYGDHSLLLPKSAPPEGCG